MDYVDFACPEKYNTPGMPTLSPTMQHKRGKSKNVSQSATMFFGNQKINARSLFSVETEKYRKLRFLLNAVSVTLAVSAAVIYFFT